VGVANYNALYSSFGAIPIFLAWLQISWLVVLAGAQIAASHQNSTELSQRKRLANADPALKESISLAALLHIGRAFVACQRPVSRAALCNELNVPEPLLSELLDRLIRAQLLVTTGQPNDPSYVLARPPHVIHMKDVLDALRRHQGAPADAFVGRAPLGQKAALLWQELDQSLAGSSANRTLQDVLLDDEHTNARGDDQPTPSDMVSPSRRDPVPAE
ncbi:MAG TPA: YhjD/YihY/BrkB family envelope integrity protein, partial [Polyangiales bacterium]|nr:YhjD/YihY/BrkB family envelope integrity protein [Polyangiales bacterium]